MNDFTDVSCLAKLGCFFQLAMSYGPKPPGSQRGVTVAVNHVLQMS